MTLGWIGDVGGSRGELTVILAPHVTMGILSMGVGSGLVASGVGSAVFVGGVCLVCPITLWGW